MSAGTAVRPAQAHTPRAPAGLPRLLTAATGHAGPALAAHIDRHGTLPRPGGRADRERLLAEVSRAGLTGRGGAAFPLARKLASVAAGRHPVVIANGTEGEPASAKDKVLMVRAPHLVLDGAVMAAALTGAAEAVIVAHPAARPAIDEALRERRLARIDQVRVSVRAAAAPFTAGEARAVVHWVERGIPAARSGPRLAERGLHGRPTLVSNVETLAHLALIVRYGADWFRSAGTGAEPGSMLITTIGAVRHPGVAEIAIGMPVSSILELAGGPSRPLSALLIGGYSGAWVDAADAAGRPFSAAGLAGTGASPGAGLIAALPAAACGLCETARVAGYLAAQSAKQCGTCVLGLDAIATDLSRLAGGRAVDMSRLRRWLGQVDGRGGCGHPSGMVRLVRTALDVFADRVDRHAAGDCHGGVPVLPVPSREADGR